MSMISSLVHPLPYSAIQAMLGLHVAGPIVPPPIEPPPVDTPPFGVSFGDAALTITPNETPAPATFAVTFGDGSLSITP